MSLETNTHTIDSFDSREPWLQLLKWNTVWGVVPVNPEFVNSQESQKTFLRTQIQPLFEWMVEDLRKQWRYTTYSREYITTIIAGIVIRMGNELGSRFSSVRWVSYNWGILRFSDAKNQEIYKLNIVSAWNLAIQSSKERENLIKQSQEEERKLLEQINKDEFLWGSVVLKYVLPTAWAIAWWNALYHASQNTIEWIRQWWNLIWGTARAFDVWRNFLRQQGQMSIRELWIKTPQWMIPVDLGNQIITGTRDFFRANILKITQTLGILFDPVTKRFIHIAHTLAKISEEIIRNGKYQDLKKKYWLNISEQEFQKLKWKMGEFNKFLSTWVKTTPQILATIERYALQPLIFPVFFRSFHEKQWMATLMAGIAEWQAFNLWAKWGAHVGRFFWKWWEILWWLIWGWIGIYGWHRVWEKLWWDQQKWKTFNGKWEYTWKNSVLLHIATSYGIPISELWDAGNALWNTFWWKVLNDYQEKSMDFWIPRFDWGRYIDSKWTGTTPDIEFISRKVHLGMDPWKWFSGRIWRDIDGWNKQVDIYSDALVKDILNLAERYQKNIYPFDKSVSNDEKIKIFKEYLIVHVLRWWTESVFVDQQLSIATLVIDEVKKWQWEKSQKIVKEYVEGYVSFMKIDPLFIRVQEWLNIARHESIALDLKKFATKLGNPDTQIYVQSLLERVQKGDNLFTPDEIDEGSPFDDRVYITKSKEHKIFDALLNSQDEIDWEVPDEAWNMRTEKRKIGIVFTKILNDLAQHGLHNDFLRRIKKIDQTTNGADWVEWEWLKSKVVNK